MNKKGKSKFFAIAGIFMVFLLITGVFMTASDEKDIQQTTDKTDSTISDDISGYVESFAEKRGINPDDINNITQVRFDDLPKEVSIENVNDNNLAIYQIDYNRTSEEQDKIFVITYSVETLQSQGDIIIAQDKREFLNFGFNGEINSSTFLKSATGVEGSLNKGYVMMRKGSITGISTDLEVLNGEGNIEIVIYKNGEAVNFGNSFVINSAGIAKDYDIQSKNTVNFEPGDIISVYAKASEGLSWKDAISLIEITTD